MRWPLLDVPKIDRLVMPGPLIVRSFLLTTISPVVSVIVLHTPARPLASTVSPSSAPATAARRLPMPASLQLVTKVMASASGLARHRTPPMQTANGWWRETRIRGTAAVDMAPTSDPLRCQYRPSGPVRRSHGATHGGRARTGSAGDRIPHAAVSRLRTAVETVVEHDIALLHLVGADVGCGSRHPCIGRAALIVGQVRRVVALIDAGAVAEQRVGLGEAAVVAQRAEQRAAVHDRVGRQAGARCPHQVVVAGDGHAGGREIVAHH